MITYSLKDTGIFSVKFSGKVSVEDIKTYILELERITYLPDDFLSLYDLRDADLNIDVDDVTSISRLSSKISAPYKIVRTAFIVNKPDVTAYSIIFKDSAPKEVEREVFSTEEAAIKWLKNE